MKDKETKLYEMLKELCDASPRGSARGFLFAKAKRLLKEIEDEREADI